MTKWSAILIVLAFLFLFNGPGAQAYTNVDFSFSFHDGLSPYGSWVNASHYGNSWRPSGAGFRPYVNGYWSYTSYGPTWIGNEPYAWSVYHYGQWVFDPVYGWVWVPGYEWHAGRVNWAYGTDYIGWAPDYPGFDQSNINLWVFINRNNFGYTNYSNVVLRRDMVQNLFDRRVVRVRSGSFQRAELERIVGRPVLMTRVRERTLLADGHRTRLIVPEGHDDVWKQVSSMSKNHGNSEKQKVTTSRKVEVKHDSHGKSVHKSTTNIQTSSKATVKHDSHSSPIGEEKSKAHTSSKATPSKENEKHDSNSKPAAMEKSKVRSSSKAIDESGKSHNVQSTTKPKTGNDTKSTSHSSGGVEKTDGESKPETVHSKTSGTSTQQKSGKSKTSSNKPKNHSKPD